ncbi:MAG: hypothetical protein ACRECU_01980 [Methylocella sp.]
MGPDSIIWRTLAGILAFDRREDFNHMIEFLSYIVGSLVEFIRYISHAVRVVFHNVVLLAVIVAFFYGIFRLCWYGLHQLRHLRGRGPPDQSAPKNTPEEGPE